MIINYNIFNLVMDHMALNRWKNRIRKVNRQYHRKIMRDFNGTIYYETRYDYHGFNRRDIKYKHLTKNIYNIFTSLPEPVAKLPKNYF